MKQVLISVIKVGNFTLNIQSMRSQKISRNVVSVGWYGRCKAGRTCVFHDMFSTKTINSICFGMTFPEQGLVFQFRSGSCDISTVLSCLTSSFLLEQRTARFLVRREAY